MSRSDREVWEAALHDMATLLDELEVAIERGDTLPSLDFTPPADLPPLPPECADQATSLSEKNQELASAISAILAEHPAPPHRKRPATGPSRSHRTARLDVSA